MKLSDKILVEQIADRAEDITADLSHGFVDFLPTEHGEFYNQIYLSHIYCPLDLKAFLKSSDDVFTDEMNSIHDNLNLIKREFDNWFVPRFALKH